MINTCPECGATTPILQTKDTNYPCNRCTSPERPQETMASRIRKQLRVTQIRSAGVITGNDILASWKWEERFAEKSLADVIRETWQTIAHGAGIRPDEKCEHGVYIGQYYCSVCSWTRVDPDYDVNRYREEIAKALASAKQLLTGTAPDLEGGRDFEDLRQLCDLEIWKAIKHYGDTMSKARAYMVAYNTRQAYLKRRLKEQSISITDHEGKPVLDEFGGEQRIPRFTRIDARPEDDDGNQKDLSPAELETIQKQGELERQEEDWVWTEHVEALAALVSTWHGIKRLVAEAMLKPDFNVRSVPGVSKTSVARILPTIKLAFHELIAKSLPVNKEKGGTN